MKIIDNPQIKTSELMKQLKEKFGVYSYWNDEELDANFLPPKNKTTRYFKDEQESTDCKGMSWNEMPEKESMMTFREYIIAFMQYHAATGKYLDENGWTLFKDRLSSGKVACGYWYPDPDIRKVKFDWYYPDGSNSDFGARLAISPVPSTSFPSDNSLEERVKSLENDMEKIKKFLII
jgi:hypothetical protein